MAGIGGASFLATAAGCAIYDDMNKRNIMEMTSKVAMMQSSPAAGDAKADNKKVALSSGEFRSFPLISKQVISHNTAVCSCFSFSFSSLSIYLALMLSKSFIINIIIIIIIIRYIALLYHLQNMKLD